MTWKTLAAAVLGFGLIWTVGCDKKDSAKPDDKKKEEPHGDHGTGPHGGTVFDFGGGTYHGEFKPNHTEKSATIWILADDEKTPAPVKTDKIRLVVSNTNPKIEIDLLPAEKSADGKAHTFTGKNDGFGVEMEYKGTARFNIGKDQFSGEFEEKPDPKK
jgi:hypothetical protein